MTLFDYLVLLLTGLLTIVIMSLSFGKISNLESKFNYKYLLFLLIGSFIIVYNAYNNESTLKIIIVLLILIFSSYFLYREMLSKTIVNTLICYLLMLLYEILLSILVTRISIFDMETFNNNIILKLIFSVINVGLVYLTSLNKKIQKIVFQINEKLKNNKLILLMFSIVIIILVTLDFRYYTTFSTKIYLTNLVVIICLIVLISISLYNNIKAVNEMEKSEQLLNFMSKYEKIIDEGRINKHEMLNNLLFLKSIEDKNSKEFNETLNDLINEYDKKGIGIKNIYNLPSGLKGIFYYKLSGLNEKGFNININISKQISSSLKKIEHKEYLILYKVIGILLDNAVEAAYKTKERIINIDIYKDNKNIIIEINNTFSNKIDFSIINDKNYSSKGKNRGLGLYIVKNLLIRSNIISLEQKLDHNYFISQIIVNKKKN